MGHRQVDPRDLDALVFGAAAAVLLGAILGAPAIAATLERLLG